MKRYRCVFEDHLPRSFEWQHMATEPAILRFQAQVLRLEEEAGGAWSLDWLVKSGEWEINQTRGLDDDAFFLVRK